MKSPVILVLALLLIEGCSKDETTTDRSVTSEPLRGDTLSVHERDRLIRRYFQQVEREVGMDLGISEDTIEARIQQLIDEGHIAKPIVFFRSKNGWVGKALDYKSYKAYREDHPINAPMPFVLESDTAAYENLRRDLLKLLDTDSLSRIDY